MTNWFYKNSWGNHLIISFKIYDKRAQDFRGLQTFTYLYENESLSLPSFYKDILEQRHIEYEEISTLIDFMLNNFGNEKICQLLKGMILFNDIPEPILSKFFARAYTLESAFYGTTNQNLMKKNYNIHSTYIKLLYKGIINIILKLVIWFVT